MDVPIPRKATSTEAQQWRLRKEYLNMVKDSPYYLTAPPPPPDIERYSDKYKVVTTKRSLREIETSKSWISIEKRDLIEQFYRFGLFPWWTSSGIRSQERQKE